MTWLERPPDLRVAYIAGPYSARTIFGRLLNIYRAGKVALKYWELGSYAVVCPHLNSIMFGELMFKTDKCDYNTWLNGDMAILRRCDTVVMMHGWQKSPGACREWELAKRLNKEILYE